MRKSIIFMIAGTAMLFLGCFASVNAQAEGTNTISTTSLVLISVGVLGVLGLIIGAGLAAASKIFEVKTDPKIAEISEVLPQMNCGACGCPGCSGFAEALVKKTASPNACRPGGDKVAQAIGHILGVKVEATIPPVATILCTRKKDVKVREIYNGIQDCNACVTMGTNIYECAHACLGLGSCVRVCPFHAIYMDENNMPVVNEEKCTACGLCVGSCPLNIIRMTPRDRNVHILCISTEATKIRAKVHKKGACIGCGKCVKTCPVTAISLVNTLAVIDYTKCTNCESCIAVCPTKAISKIRFADKPPSVEKASEQAHKADQSAKVEEASKTDQPPKADETPKADQSPKASK